MTRYPEELAALVGAYEDVFRAGFPSVPGAADAHLRDLQQRSAAAEANWRFVQAAVGLLPSAVSDPRSKYQYQGVCFLDESPVRANGILASVVWLPDARERSRDVPGGEPFYVIGKCVVGRNAELLLAGARRESTVYGRAIMTAVSHDSKGVESVLLAMQSRVGTELSPEQVEALYDKTSRRLIVDRVSDGSVMLAEGGLLRPFGRGDSRPRIRIESRPKPWDDAGRLEPGIVERFGVVERLAVLAVNFGVGDHLRQVILGLPEPQRRSNLERYVQGREE